MSKFNISSPRECRRCFLAEARIEEMEHELDRVRRENESLRESMEEWLTFKAVVRKAVADILGK